MSSESPVMCRRTSARSQGSGSWQKAASGFTLLELMITVAIVAILSTIAYASYTNQVTKTRRAAAANCLQERAQLMERFYTTNLTYAGAVDPPPQCDGDISPQHYAVSFTVAPGAKDYTLAATPQNGQATNDTLCGVLSLTAQGLRGETGSASVASECW